MPPTMRSKRSVPERLRPDRGHTEANLTADRDTVVRPMAEISTAIAPILTLPPASSSISDQSADVLGKVRILINARRYAEALQILNAMSVRTAEWYYLAAIANYGAGNIVLGMDYAKRAAETEPDNPRYADLVDRMENAGFRYRTAGQTRYGMPRLRVNKFCLGLFLTNLLCNLINCFCSNGGYGGYYGGYGGSCFPFFCC